MDTKNRTLTFKNTCDILVIGNGMIGKFMILVENSQMYETEKTGRENH